MGAMAKPALWLGLLLGCLVVFATAQHALACKGYTGVVVVYSNHGYYLELSDDYDCYPEVRFWTAEGYPPGDCFYKLKSRSYSDHDRQESWYEDSLRPTDARQSIDLRFQRRVPMALSFECRSGGMTVQVIEKHK